MVRKLVRVRSMAEIKPGGRTNGRGVSLIPIGDWRGEAGCRVHFGFLCFDF